MLIRALVILIICGISTHMATASPINNMQKIGSAKLEIFFFDIYYSELYSLTGKYSSDERPLALQIKYLRDIKADDLIERTQEEWEKLGILNEQTNAWVGQLKALWPDINKQDMLTIVVDQQGVSEFFFNDAPLGVIDDTEFGKSFLAIWLDENCSFPKLRKKLIGG